VLKHPYIHNGVLYRDLDFSLDPINHREVGGGEIASDVDPQVLLNIPNILGKSGCEKLTIKFLWVSAG